MIDEELFNIRGLAESVMEVLPQECQSERIISNIMAVFQKTFTQPLVPKNLNNYITKKKKEAWITELKRKEFEMQFWKRIVRQAFPEEIHMCYARVDQLLTSAGLKKLAAKETLLTCFYCERVMDAGRFGGEIGIYCTRDHVIPKSKGGNSRYYNLVNACNDCNFLKADLSLQNFINKLHNMIVKKVKHTSIPFELYPTIIKNANKLIK